MRFFYLFLLTLLILSAKADAGGVVQPCGSSGGGGCPCNGYAHARSITFQSSQVGTINHTDQSNFPAVVYGTLSYLATTPNGGFIQNTATLNGHSVPTDLIFTTDSGCLNKLNWEMANYTAGSGAFVAWVRIPTLSHSTNTVIYMCYGNSLISTYQGAATSTWDSNYKLVYHMQDNAASTTIIDSTSNANNATAQANTSGKTTTGLIGSALTWNGATDYAVSGSTVAYTGGQPVTFSCWTNSSGASQRTYTRIFETDYSKAGTLAVNSAGTGYFYGTGSDSAHVFGGSISSGTWTYVAGVYDGTNSNLYVNGASVGTPTPETTATGALAAYIAVYNGNTAASTYEWNGLLEDCHYSSTNRSPDWIVTEYNNQSAPGSFYIIGSAM